MRRFFRRSPLILGLCPAWLLIASLAAAQTPDTAALQGVVVGPNGAPLPGASLVIEDEHHRIVRTVHAGSQGTFAAEGLSTGSPLFVTAAFPGFAMTRSGAIVLASGSTASVRLRMQIAAARTEVRVTGDAGEVRTDEPQMGDRLTPEQMRNTPLLNRRITGLPLLNAANRPAIDQGDIFMNQILFTANGTGRRQTWFEVDGASGNDAWGRQTIFTNTPLDSIAEMTVLDNAFAANYGFGEGAVVNIVTRSGGDTYHGRPAWFMAAFCSRSKAIRFFDDDGY